MADTAEQTKGQGTQITRWLLVVVGVAVVGYVVYRYFSGPSIHDRMKEVRKAKEEKRLANLVDNVSEN